ncbi:MAG: zinc metallopeptidase [Clostridia bacterium]|nr:zinc metallopeptidase [Clostridia bacterium]
MIWIILGVVAFGVLLCFLLAIANHSGERFLERYEEVDKIEVRNDIAPIEFVAQINEKHFNKKLKVIEISDMAADAYSKGNLFLSWKTLKNNSIASFTIMAHELGHALQDKEGNKLKKLNFLRRLGRVLGLLLVPSFLAGGILLLFGEKFFYWGVALLGVGGFIFLLALFIKLRTISIEKDASKKAIILLQDYLNEKELKESKKFLNDAKLTYWADFLRIFLWWSGMSRKTKLFN